MFKCKECKTEDDLCEDCIKQALYLQEENYKQYLEKQKEWMT